MLYGTAQTMIMLYGMAQPMIILYGMAQPMIILYGVAQLMVMLHGISLQIITAYFDEVLSKCCRTKPSVLSSHTTGPCLT
jgi:hypothetical protein